MAFLFILIKYEGFIPSPVMIKLLNLWNIYKLYSDDKLLVWILFRGSAALVPIVCHFGGGPDIMTKLLLLFKKYKCDG